ncbi:hypothetical protein SAY86_028157 [Trapa natans]|uniref:Uncharacterized protein n=1 Tax=Trapa natans TaxID=22666 RepID=A0AAN7MH81_TRANT|nr:hypothetical protein SAY86_028157 [Trapa natans]
METFNSSYVSKIILASSADEHLLGRLKSFESSVGLCRKTFSYGGEGLYYFVEQFVWLAKSGLIDKRLLPNLQKISQWTEFVGYTGSISLKIRDLRGIREEEACLESSIEIATSRGIGHKEEDERLRELMGNKLMKRLSIFQDLADDLTALADIRDGRDVLGVVSRGIGHKEEDERLRELMGNKLMKRLSILQIHGQILKDRQPEGEDKLNWISKGNAETLQLQDIANNKNIFFFHTQNGRASLSVQSHIQQYFYFWCITP